MPSQTRQGPMFDHPVRKRYIVSVFMLAAVLQIQCAVAENRMQLKKASDNSINLELSNSDPIAGFQFSLHGRGGIVWEEYQGSVRTSAAGLAIYQYRVNDSTLNVVLLAPYCTALGIGQGIIGTIGFTVSSEADTEILTASLEGVVICDAHSKVLEVSPSKLVWRRLDQKSTVFTLEQNFPNPFNPSTTIAYTLASSASVRLTVYDLGGRLIHTLVDEFQEGGRHAIAWNAGDNRGRSLASGMYFARLEVGGQVAIKKMILTK